MEVETSQEKCRDPSGEARSGLQQGGGAGIVSAGRLSCLFLCLVCSALPGLNPYYEVFYHPTIPIASFVLS